MSASSDAAARRALAESCIDGAGGASGGASDGALRSAAEMLHKPRAWDSQMFALRDWIGYHWSQRG